ncbi:MAG: ABC transporter permease subunit [Candidatus Neomarinimicrobiota bacterium]|nr:ABC transporter permease subunit [Candidatus Neomarinimicrobiota bacterium]
MKKIETILITFFLWIFILFMIYPVLNIISISLRTDNAFQVKSLSLFEKAESYIDENKNGKYDIGEQYDDTNLNLKRDNGSSLKSYSELFLSTSFLKWTYNSMIVSLIVTLSGVMFASIGGYAFSRFKFKGRQFGLLTILSTQMFPATMLLLPFFILLSKLKLIDSYLGLIIIYTSTALPFCIWQMKSYYDTIPVDLEEASRLDGCNKYQSFYLIILPLAKPALVITALFSFMTSWSEYVIAAIVLQNPELYTLPLGLKSFQASLSTQWGLYAAGAVVVSIPVTILFIALSRFLVSGLTLGSVKG